MAKHKLTRPEKATIHFGDRDGEDDPRFLHADKSRIPELVNGLADEFERRIREHNGGDQERKLCGGCVMATVDNVIRELLRRGDPTNEQAGGWGRTLRRTMSELAYQGEYQEDQDGPDAPFFEAE